MKKMNELSINIEYILESSLCVCVCVSINKIEIWPEGWGTELHNIPKKPPTMNSEWMAESPSSLT